MTKKQDAIILTPGSKYEIQSLGPREKPFVTLGIFRGYTQVGNVDGLCVELDATHGKLRGKIRVIPSHMILSIVILNASVPKPQMPEESLEKCYR